MKVSINETTLTNIGAAIREKTGKTDLIAPGDMPAEIRAIESGGGGGELPRVVETEDVDYFFAYDHFNWYLDLVPSFTLKIKDTNNNINSLFQDCSKEMPMSKVIVVGKGIAGLTGMFMRASSITELPEFRINNTQRTGTADVMLGNFFVNCNSLAEIPEDFWRNKDENGNLLDGYWTNGEYYTLNGAFNSCYSLRNVFLPLKPGGSVVSSFNATNTFANCYALESIVFPVTLNMTGTSTLRTNTFQNCNRLKSLKLQTLEDGTPIESRWYNLTLDLSSYIGYCSTASNITSYSKSHGITTATQVKDDATYQALKNNPDWWTADINYSRYNHDSAVETINSLPMTAGDSYGKNTIKFKGASGAKTDGGAINTLTEAEIAVATAKGWTVTIA